MKELVAFWRQQGIPISPGKKEAEIKSILNRKKLFIPNDFHLFYQQVNAFELLYPNGSDKSGFLFYPVEHINAWKELMSPKTHCIVFGDYMQKSWWYGVRFGVADVENYEIGIIPIHNQFIPITNNLNTFFQLYITDDEELYAVQKPK